MLEVEKTAEFNEWFDGLRDRQSRLRLNDQIDRISSAEQYVGDWKSVGEGVIESRFFFGPGFRIYSSIENGKLLLVLIGGDKSTQRQDIKKAQELLTQWRATNAEAERRRHGFNLL